MRSVEPEVRSSSSIRRAAALLFSALALVLQSSGPAGAEGEETPSNAFITLTRTALDPAELPANAAVITSKEIERSGVQNAGDALDNLVGINVQKNTSLGSTRLPKLRGFLNKQVAVYVDNRRVPPDVTGSVDLAQIPAEQIERIEVVRGAASVLYGPNAEGGVIHIITKRASGSLPRVSAETAFKSFGTSVLRGQGWHKSGRLEGLVTGSRTKSDGFMVNSRFENTSLGGNFGYDFARAGKTYVDFSVSRSENGTPGGTPFRPDQFDGQRERRPNDPTFSQKDNNDSVRVEHKAALAEIEGQGNVSLTTRLSGSRSQRRAFRTSITTSTVESRGAFFQLDFPLGFTMGVEYDRTRVDSPFAKTPETNSWGVFFQENFSYKGLTVIPGVRYDRNTEWGDTTNPRIAVIYRLSDRLKFSASAGTAFQAPTFADMTDFDPVTGDATARTLPGPFPEKSTQYEAGFEAAPIESVNVKFTAFRAVIKDRLAFQSAGFGGTVKNLQKSVNQGVEGEISHQAGPFRHDLNYAYLSSKGEGPGFSNEPIELRFAPAHRLNYLMNLSVSPWDAELGSSLQYVSQQWTGNNRAGLKLPDYAVWNLSASKKVGILELRVGVDNVLERRYAQNATEGFAGFTPDLFFPQPGRTYWGSVAVKFL